MLQYMDTFPDLLTRENEMAHFTASCWIVNPARTHALMAFHNLYQSWAWLGGHADGEEDLLRAKIKACEDEMEACGAREVELDNEINSPEVYNDPDLLRQKSDELSDLRFHQEELFAAWEAAMEEQEAYEQTQQPEE